MTLLPIVRLMRPHQYTKNLLVFSAPGAAGRLDEGRVIGLAFAAFALFCLVSSAGYVANDLADVEADRRHPTKRRRPIADGSVRPQTARVLMTVLAAGAVALALPLGAKFTAWLVGYAVLSAAYSSRLKRVPWVELAVVSAGFVIRAIAGGAATDTPISGWFLLVVSAGALLLITGKRLGELLTHAEAHASRAVLAGYSLERLRTVAVVAAGLAVGGYATWAAAEAADQATGSWSSNFLRLTAFPFGLAIGRYLMLSWHGRGETPEALVMRDPVVVIAGVGWVLIYALGLYA